MRCPRLIDLPNPTNYRTGWPWTEQSLPLPDVMSSGLPWPKISVVTPSYNQGPFIEETIRSVLLQGYPNLEYIIMDGGSTDETVQIVRRYEPFISHWETKKDRGQSHAVNKGFSLASGELIGWQNSDDFYHQDCFVQAALASQNDVMSSVFYGQVPFIDAKGSLVRYNRAADFQLQDGIPWFSFANQCIFFRATIFRSGHFLDESYDHNMDADFYWRLIGAGYRFRYVPTMGGSFRLHSEAKGTYQSDVNLREAHRLFLMLLKPGFLPSAVREVALERFRAHLCLHFDRRDFVSFRAGVWDLLNNGGWQHCNLPIVARYLLSWGGRHLANVWQMIKTIYETRHSSSGR